MKTPFAVPDETVAMQSRAADPANSAWVSANAGSGKTHVLAQRVIRLLLEGTDPSKILCLTYTRAAAANMSNRVFTSLAEWALLGDEELAAGIGALEGGRPTRRRMERARRLFAEALETPGGLKIQTIHAFCESLLHQFPLEANIAAHFELLDPAMEAALFADARRELVTGAVASGNPVLAEAFAMVLERAGEAGLDALLAEIVARRDALRDFIDRVGQGDGTYPPLFEEFGFAPDETAAAVAAMAWPLPGFTPDYFSAFAANARASSASTVLEHILPQAEAAFAEPDPVRRLSLLAAGLLKADGKTYDPAKAFKKALVARMPDLPGRYLEAAEAVVAASDRVALLRMVEGTQAALRVADWLIGRYEQLKAGRGFLDFNDLIVRTVRLLSREDAGAWVQYKLDRGIDHILLDEAQDTSPEQWDVVRRLAEEFFAGLGARNEENRTIFAVGDEKQSIYSFQGAAPESFDAGRQEFAARVRAAGRGFADVKLSWSFRSTEDVLNAVDAVFAPEAVRTGVTRDPEPPLHKAIRAGAPGYVELWPSLPDVSVDEPDDWAEAIDHAKIPAVRLAETIAGTIRHWLKSGEMLEGRDRPLRPGDIMVLVRRRDRFVHALSRALKERNVPVAGADRLRLPAHIAIRDMVALGRCLLLQDDDLSLAAVLKSPIFGLDENILFELAAQRAPGVSLAASLRSAAGRDEALGALVDRLDRWGAEAAFKPVFEFYAGLLGRDGVRARMIARLGREAGDILDEFLNFCLAQERVGLPGLEAFLATLEEAGPEIKREMDQGRDEVRIMTVHAAKGLEAPVVFLVDSGARPFSDQYLPRLMPFESARRLWQGRGFLWRSSVQLKNTVSRRISEGLKDRADEEYRRLLYVGMTRAEDRLIICGYHGKTAQIPSTWHMIVGRALTRRVKTVAHPVTGEPVKRFRITRRGPVVRQREAGMPPKATTESLPSTLRGLAPPSRDLPRPLAPSGAAALIEMPAADMVVDGRSPVLDAAREPAFAIRRGLALHRLLQVLPGMAEEDRAAAARRYLERVGADWPSGEIEGALRGVAAILASAAFAPLFADGSRAEVSVMGTLSLRGHPRSVAGQIDRLAVAGDSVMIVDYKTGRPAPTVLGEVPTDYVLQLALYRALLSPLYPGKQVSAALLFTEAPRLIAVPAAAMDAAIARLDVA